MTLSAMTPQPERTPLPSLAPRYMELNALLTVCSLLVKGCKWSIWKCILLAHYATFSASFIYWFQKPEFIGHSLEASCHVRHLSSICLLFREDKQLLIKWNLPNYYLSFPSPLNTNYSISDVGSSCIYLKREEAGAEVVVVVGFRKYSNLGRRCAMSVNNNQQIVRHPDVLENDQCWQSIQKGEW